MLKAALCILAATLLACRHVPLSYQLQGQGRSLILVPPVRSTSVKVPHARGQSRTQVGCDIEGELLNLRWHGNTALIQLKSVDFLDASGGERLYTDSLKAIE